MTKELPTNIPGGGKAHPCTASGPAAPLQAEQSAEVPERLPELTLGRRPVAVEPVAASLPKSPAAPAEADLSLIEARCRLKANGARWAARRHRRLAEGANFAIDIDPVDRGLIASARGLPNCFLWMCHPTAPSPSDFDRYETVGGCFDAVADVVCLLRQTQDEPASPRGEWEKLLNLLAEAQSSLRVAIAAIHGPTDTDQWLVFNWLKATTTEKHVFIPRHMRIDDPADPAQWGDLYVRIEAMGAVMRKTRRRDTHRKELLAKLRHTVSCVTTDAKPPLYGWQILIATVEELVRDGLPPSNRELRELLAPIIDRLPDLPDVPHGFQLVLREIDRDMATRPTPEAPVATPPTPEVREVARLLNGRSMVLIGGDQRPASCRALQDAFQLQELIWIETREHESIASFEPSIARPDVAVVVLAIRWSSHSFGEVREFCDRHGKPLVRLPGGYNPNQVAVQILSQCSTRLSEK